VLTISAVQNTNKSYTIQRINTSTAAIKLKQVLRAKEKSVEDMYRRRPMGKLCSKMHMLPSTVFFFAQGSSFSKLPPWLAQIFPSIIPNLCPSNKHGSIPL
jgi:hypothetical protein